MSEETIQWIAAAVVTLAQVYVLEPWKFPVFAKFWDAVAKVCGLVANIAADWAMKARVNYFDAVNAYGETS